jgi:hypothetical protein
MGALRKRIEAWMSAVAFAEAGLHDVAIGLMGIKQPTAQIRPIEIPGVRVWYGLATVNL